MRLLLDTHTLIWWADGKPLAADAAVAIGDSTSTVFVSAVSVWEAEIKVEIGKLQVGFDLETALVEHSFEPLAITFAHAIAAGRLPPHHRDPFDRMLVAQAQLEGLTLVTRHPVFGAYEVPVLAA